MKTVLDWIGLFMAIVFTLSSIVISIVVSLGSLMIGIFVIVWLWNKIF